MKDRNLIWLFFPFIFIMGFFSALYFDYEVLYWKQQIIDFVPYIDVVCMGCCTIRCYEFALLDAIKKRIILPYFIIIVAIIFIIVVLVMTYFEIKKEKKVIKLFL